MISDKVCKLQVVSRKDIPVSVLVICLLGTARLREGGVIGVLPICLTLIQEWKVANPDCRKFIFGRKVPTDKWNYEVGSSRFEVKKSKSQVQHAVNRYGVGRGL